MPVCLLNRKKEKIQSYGPTPLEKCLFFHFFTSCFHSLERLFLSGKSPNTLLSFILGKTKEWKFSSNISKTSARVSSGIPNTEKQTKARGRRPSAFSFEVIGTLDETRSTSFWDDFSNETIKKYVVIHFFVLSSPNERTIIYAPMQYCHIT